MSTIGMLLVVIICMAVIGVIEHRGDEMIQDTQIRKMILDARKPKPSASRNPTRFGVIGYKLPRRRGLWRLLS